MKKIKKMALIGLTCMTMLFGLAACGEKKDTGVTAGGADTDSVQAGGAEAGGQIVFGTNAELSASMMVSIWLSLSRSEQI